jgi:hypothetical protein
MSVSRGGDRNDDQDGIAKVCVLTVKDSIHGVRQIVP